MPLGWSSKLQISESGVWLFYKDVVLVRRLVAAFYTSLVLGLVRGLIFEGESVRASEFFVVSN